MAWTYSDWITYKRSAPAAALSRLQLHIQEVSDKIGREVSADGKAVSSSALTQYLDRISAQEAELLAALGPTEGGGGVTYANFNRDVLGGNTR